MKRALTAMETCHQGSHVMEHHFSRAAKMVETGSGARRAIADHIEDVLGMVALGARTGQPYEAIARLKLTAPCGKQREPVTICHGFKGGTVCHPPCGKRSTQIYGTSVAFGSNRGVGGTDEEEA